MMTSGVVHQQPAEFLGTPLTGRSRSVQNDDDPAKVAAGRYKQGARISILLFDYSEP